MFPAPEYRVIRWLFARLLAVVYLIAFISWGCQYRGLVGKDGIAPASALIQRVHAYEAQSGSWQFLNFPTLQYFDGSDGFAYGLIGVCCALAVLALVGVAQAWMLAGIWIGYLSLSVTGDVFMGFQWDALLLEAGLLGIWVAPWGLWRGRAAARAPAGSIFLLHWLLFRLMLLSGIVKYWSGDPVWRDMTALLYHFETQPLPHLLSWYAHQLPRTIQIVSCWLMYGVELILPFFIFFGRWGRLIACAGFVSLMALISATGNYNFFNLLTAILALTLLDDSWWPAKMKSRLFGSSGDLARKDDVFPRWLKRLACAGVAGAVIVLTSLAGDSFLASRVRSYKGYLPEWAHKQLYAAVAPFRSFNAYGLFQDMTTERFEVVVEVSDDGLLWLPLEFKWKPGNVKRAPRWAAPHQPRLDWQMWFAALYPGYDPGRDGPGSGNAWFGAFLSALLEQKQPVWDLLEPPPLPQKSIRHIRARLYRYHFTTPEERRESGAWWRREYVGAYSPAFSVGQIRSD